MELEALKSYQDALTGPYVVIVRCRVEFNSTEFGHPIDQILLGLALKTHLHKMEVLKVLEDNFGSENMGLKK